MGYYPDAWRVFELKNNLVNRMWQRETEEAALEHMDKVRSAIRNLHGVDNLTNKYDYTYECWKLDYRFSNDCVWTLVKEYDRRDA